MDIIKFLKSVFILLTVFGIAVWVGIVWKAESAEELKEACYPLDWALGGTHDIIAGLIGRDPKIIRQIQKHVVNGCYYFVWRVQPEYSEKNSL